ncbi:hypothetical protein TNCV_1474951 [Trichonephila clavipes]|nr:hypothetical protein TNCV_1474951 [Trichonephila clavipes]
MQVTVRRCSIPPNFDGEHFGDAQGSPISLPLPPTSLEDLRIDGYLEYPLLRRHYTFTNIYAFSRIQIQVLRHRNVAKEFDIAHSVVSRLWKSFKTTGMCSRRHGGGRVRSTTPAEDRYIVLSAKRNRRTTAQQVANQFLAASGKQISRKTVARRLRGGEDYTHADLLCVSH